MSEFPLEYNVKSKILALWFLVVVLGLSAQAQTLEQVEAKLESARAGVKTLDADARLDFRLIMGFIPYSESLNGRYHYQAPDNHSFEFPDAPSYLQKLPGLFNWKLPSKEKYVGKLKGPFPLDGRQVYKLLYIPLNAESKVQSVTISVDSSNWSFVKHDTDYKDGGTLNLVFTHTEKQGNQILDDVQARLNLTSFKISGTAAITLTNHKLNEG